MTPVRIKVEAKGSIYEWTFFYQGNKYGGLATTPADAKRAGLAVLREVRPARARQSRRK